MVDFFQIAGDPKEGEEEDVPEYEKDRAAGDEGTIFKKGFPMEPVGGFKRVREPVEAGVGFLVEGAQPQHRPGEAERA